MEMTRRAMAPPKEEGQQSNTKAAKAEAQEPEQEKEPEQEGVDRALAAGLRKLYDPILEEQVPPEMLEILRRGRKGQ